MLKIINRKKIIIPIFMVLVGLTIVTYIIYNNKVNTFNSDLFKKEAMTTMLDRSYYDDDKVQFSSVAINNDYINVYQMYWCSEIIDIINCKEYKKDMLECIKYIDSNDDNLEDIKLITGLYRNLNYTSYDKNKYLNIISDHFDIKNNLFFYKDINEDISMKLNASITVIKILKNMEAKTEEADKVKTKLIALYNNDDNFKNSKDSNEELFGNGIPLILALKELNYNFNDLDKSDLRKEWIHNVNINFVKNHDKSQINSIPLLKSIIDVNEFFKENYLGEEFLRNCLESSTNFKNLAGVDYFKALDSQLIYNNIYLYKYINVSYPYDKELRDYIKKSIDSKFNSIGNISLNIVDNYYGIMLANKNNFSYSKDTIINYLNEMLESQLTYFDANKDENLKAIYYLLLSYDALSQKISDANYDRIYSKISNELVTQNINKVSLKKELDKFYFGTLTLKLINKETSPEIKNNINDLIGYIDREGGIYSTMDVYKLYSVLDQSKNYKDYEVILNKINKSIVDLSDSDGGYKTRTDGSSNLISTYNIISLKHNLGKISKEEKRNIRKYLYNNIEKEDLNGFKIKEQPVDLYTIYIGMMLMQLCL